MNSVKLVLFLSALLGVNGFRQFIGISEGPTYSDPLFSSHYYASDNPNASGILKESHGMRTRGMWQVQAAKSDEEQHHSVTSHFSLNDDFRDGQFSEAYRHHTAVRRMGSVELTEEGLSLYEGAHSGVGVFPKENFFQGKNWTGEPFRLHSFAMTGWSNWTLHEGANYTGQAYCIRSTYLYTFGNTDESWPSVVGSVVKDCDQGTRGQREIILARHFNI